MSLALGYSWSHRDLHFVGYTLAGITTSIFCKTASVCFDVGQGLPFQNAAKHILITHAHLDHAAGLPYLLSQKTMAGQAESNVYVPPSFYEPISEILRIWQKVDEHAFSFELRAALPGQVYALGEKYTMKPFATVHRVPSQGYLLYENRKRLHEAYRAADQGEILRAKARGEVVQEHFSEPLVAFTGDTQIEGLLADPDVCRAKVLFVEVTFWDERKPIEHARKWGHIHLDELIPVLGALKNERIVLIHTSVRYSTADLLNALRERLPPEERERVVLYPRPG